MKLRLDVRMACSWFLTAESLWNFWRELCSILDRVEESQSLELPRSSSGQMWLYERNLAAGVFCFGLQFFSFYKRKSCLLLLFASGG